MIKKNSKEYQYRKKRGQFFTEMSLIEKIIDKFNLNFNDKIIIEPSCGNGAFIDGVIKSKDEFKKIIAIDIDKKTLNKLKLKYNNKIELIDRDFLKFKRADKVDMIIGNPPFNLPNKNYLDSTEGFVLKSLDLLKPGGELVLILPNTILRSKKYEFLRKKIIENTEIVSILNTFGYEFFGKDIETIAIYIKKKKVRKQIYYYFDADGSKKLINLKINDRFNILVENRDYYEYINSRIDGDKLGNVFEIIRGTFNKPIKGRMLNFYNDIYISETGEDEFIGIQNIAYRITANYIKANINDCADTVTLLIPKNKMSKEELIYISDYLNSSVCYYLLHSNSLNFSKLTIHMDKYYIEDLKVPKYTKNKFNSLNKVLNDFRGKKEMSKKRNDFFIDLLKLDNDSIDVITSKWKEPRFRNKCGDKNGSK